MPTLYTLWLPQVMSSGFKALAPPKRESTKPQKGHFIAISQGPYDQC